jgi:hypothetical protein
MHRAQVLMPRLGWFFSAIVARLLSQAAEPVGDISSVVAALGDTYDWPKEFGKLKERLRPEPSLLRDGWHRLEIALDAELEEISRRKQEIIPEVKFSDIQKNGGRLPTIVEEQLRKRGVLIVRGVVEADTALDWKAGVRKYAEDNPSHVGFPKDDPQVLELYWSKPQLLARQHPNMHTTMLALNHLWKGGKDHVSFDHVFMYGERLRMRKPGTGFSLHPHTDGGSIERFQDPHYQRVYGSFWNGQWEHYDPWALSDERALANVSMYQPEVPNGYCTVFRAFQGWMAASSIKAGPDTGTLKVLPLLRESTAHIMLRPFLDDVPAADFCGAIPGMSHDVTKKWFERIHESLVPLPAMSPGDTVWWHADLVHAVEHLHNGTEDSSVFYIPSFPATVRNVENVRRQRDYFQNGKTPPDFPPNDSEMNFFGRATDEDLTPLGRKMLGLDPLEPCDIGTDTCAAKDLGDASALLAQFNTILGFS